MGVSKGEGGGRWSPPNGWRSLGFGRRRSLSDLAVWGFPETFPENLPPQAPFNPFPPFFLPLTPSSNSSTPQNPPSNSLDQILSPSLPFLPPFYPSSPFPSPLSPFLTLYRTLSEHPRNPSIWSLKDPKRPKRPFLGLFGGFPPKPSKGPKYPFLGPFWPLFYPYPTLSKIPIYWRVTTLPSFIGKPKHGTF